MKRWLSIVVWLSLAVGCKTTSNASGTKIADHEGSQGEELKDECDPYDPKTCPAGTTCNPIMISPEPLKIQMKCDKPLLVLYQWIDVDPSYLRATAEDYLVEFGEFSDGELLPAEPMRRYYVLYRSDEEKALIDQFTSSGKTSAIFHHGIFLGKAEYNKPFSWVMRPTGAAFGDMSMEVCDGSPDYLEDTARAKSPTGWNPTKLDGIDVPHTCFWGDSPIRVIQAGKVIWRHPQYKR